MHISLFSDKKLKIALFLALPVILLLAGLGVFFLKEACLHLARYRAPVPLEIWGTKEEQSFLLFSDEEKQYRLQKESDSYRLLNRSSHALLVSFPETELSVSLAPYEEKTLSKEDFSSFFSVSHLKKTSYFAENQQQLKRALDGKEADRDIVFTSDISVQGKIHFSSPCRLDLGAFSFKSSEGLWYRSEEEGNLILLSQSQNALLLYADAPHTRIYTRESTLSYPKELYDFYLKADSVNSRACDPLRNPVTDEAMLQKLAQDPLVPASPQAVIVFRKEFRLNKDICFPSLYSLYFEAEPDFNGYRLCFESEEASEFTICSQVAVDPGALIIQAPNASLLWEGSYVPDTETLCETVETATINREDPGEYRLGGNSKAQLLSFVARQESLSSPLSFSLEGNLLAGRLPYEDNYYDLEHALLTYECQNGSLEFQKITKNEDGSVDLTKDCVILLKDGEGGLSRYRLKITRDYHDLPVIHITTQDRKEVESKKEYQKAEISVLANGSEYESLESTKVEIRGRGNSTWRWEKKPYKLKFKEELSLFGLAPSNEWILLANYADKSLIRNRLAYEMGKLLSFDYTPTQIAVDLFVNGEYAGVYTFGEHLEAGTGRIEVENGLNPEDTGYLIEVGGVSTEIHKKGVDYFHAGTLRFALVKAPGQGELSATQFTYISEMMIDADKAVTEGGDWRQYLDEESLIDWILMMELTNNTDGAFRRSCYFTKQPGEKIKMGPLWDFDLAFGNFNRDVSYYDAWATTTDDDYVGVTWTAYLLQDREFIAALYERWNEIRESLLQRAEEVIEEAALTVSASAEENFTLWDVLDIRCEMQRHDVINFNTYEKQLGYLKSFLTKRAAWMEKEITRLYEGGSYEIPVIEEEE